MKLMFDSSKYIELLESESFTTKKGKVSKVIGLTIESFGPRANVGELCTITNSKGDSILSEIVGFRDNKVLLMPLGEMKGIGNGSIVKAVEHSLRIGVSEDIVGRVFDGLGNPLDDKGPVKVDRYYPVINKAPQPLERNRITTPLTMGIKAIDGFLTIGKGQRIGIFAGSGVGKSTLMGMIARNSFADVNVIALIGERGREVRDFLERDLKKEGLEKSIIIVATSDQPALIRLKGAFLATAIAEYFRDRNKDVLLLMDSLTRFAMAQREVGLAVGEPPVSRGYTPSVFTTLPQLLERAGTTTSGSITGLYTVLVDGDDFTEPVTDTARGILDGHIVLSRELANKNHYPAVDILSSISRVMNDIVSDKQKKLSNEIKRLMAVYKESEDLINIGAYSMGSNKNIDQAIEKIDKINKILIQNVEESFTYEETLNLMQEVFSDGEV